MPEKGVQCSAPCCTAWVLQRGWKVASLETRRCLPACRSLQAEDASLRLARQRGADAASLSAADGGGGGGLCWNHAEFRVAYPSLR